jgi:hypothetical protein
MDEILSHELSHVTTCVGCCWACENLAYSEVRAARVAECRTRRARETTTKPAHRR